MSREWNEYHEALLKYWDTYERLQEKKELNLGNPEFQGVREKLDITWTAWLKSEGKPIPDHYPDLKEKYGAIQGS